MTAASRFSDQDRICTIHSVLGPDKLLLNTMTATEGMSGLFYFDLELYADAHEEPVDFARIVGERLTVEMELPDRTQRYFDGFVSRFAQGPADERFTTYRADLVPWLWFLTRTSDCRIFQEMTLPDIIEKVFQDAGFQDYSMEATGHHPVWEYCVQYRETDFNFVSRLMEQEGIFYYFKHENDKHTLVMADAKENNPPVPGQPDAEYATNPASRRAGEVYAWHLERELPSAKSTLKDYYFETPSDPLLTEQTTIDKLGSKKDFELYDFPGEYPVKVDGEERVKERMETEEAASYSISASGDLGAFCPGFRFTLRNHYRPDFNEEYLLTSVTHYIDQGLGYGDRSEPYRNSFTCIPWDTVFRPPRATSKPIVQGPQTAKVTGPAGEEIYTDKYGRVKVQFHWDREGKYDENSSCWIRVSHSWAGTAWGGITHPRIGQEVIVEFIEGDPDRPIITGRVYNAELMPPYELPKHQTISTLQSRSTKGGTADNFNEVRFEDEIGAEQVFIHAEMDMDQRVKQDSRSIVLRDRHVIVERHQKERVEGSRHGQVYGNHREKIGGSHHVEVEGDRHEKIGNVHTSESGTEIHLKAGMKVIVDAGVQIHLKVGGNHIDISPGGIVIQGTMVRINSGPASGTGTRSDPDDPAAPDVADDGSKRTKLN